MRCPCECHNGWQVPCSIPGGCGLDYHNSPERSDQAARSRLRTIPERRHDLYELLDPSNQGDRASGVPASIPVMFSKLDLQPGSGAGGRRAPGFGSMPPLSIHVLIMLDDRSKAGSPRVWFPASAKGKPDYSRPHAEDAHPPRPIRRTLLDLVNAQLKEIEAEMVASLEGVQFYGPPVSEMVFRPADHSVRELSWWLWWHVDRLAEHRDSVSIHAVLTELSEQLRRAIGDGPPDPVGRCIELVRDRRSHEMRYCGAPLFLPPPVPDDPNQTAVEISREVVTTCSSCYRKYRRLDLIRVRVAQDVA